MYVCICHGITDRAIREAADRGVDSLERLACETGVGTCCGSCRELAVRILDQAASDNPALRLVAA